RQATFLAEGRNVPIEIRDHAKRKPLAQGCQDADTDLERVPCCVTKAGCQLLLIRVRGETQVAQLQGRMLEHQWEKPQGGDLRMCHQLRIGPIKCLFDTLWRYRKANMGVETVKTRQPMHTGGI